VVDLLQPFGCRQARQAPLPVRDDTLTPLQPLMLANGTVPHRAAIFSEDSAFTAAALREDATVDGFTRDLFRRVLGREPAQDEKAWFAELLSEGFDGRLVSKPVRVAQGVRQRSNISWSNHFSVEANRMKLEQERALRAGDPPTPRLADGWRRRAEDAVWVLFNTPEFVLVP